MSLKSVIAKASRRRREIAETPPWKRLKYGWRDRLDHANHDIISAMKANPRRFVVEEDPLNDEFVIVRTAVLTPKKNRGWKEWPRKGPRQISVRLPKAVFEIRGMNGRRGNGVYEPFFLEMLSRRSKGQKE